LETKGGGDDAASWLLAILRVFVGGFTLSGGLSSQSLPAGFRSETSFQNNGAGHALHGQHLYQAHKRSRGIYLLQLFVKEVPSVLPAEGVDELDLALKKLGLPQSSELEPQCRGKRDVGKTRTAHFEERLRKYHLETERRRAGGGKRMCEDAAQVMELWPGVVIDYEMLPLCVIPKNCYDDEDAVVLMEVLGDAITHSGPTPGNSGSAVQAMRGGLRSSHCPPVPDLALAPAATLIHPPTRMFDCLSIYRVVSCLSIYLSIYLCIYLSISFSLSLPGTSIPSPPPITSDNT